MRRICIFCLCHRTGPAAKGLTGILWPGVCFPRVRAFPLAQAPRVGLKTCPEISARHKGILGCDFLSASPKRPFSLRAGRLPWPAGHPGPACDGCPVFQTCAAPDSCWQVYSLIKNVKHAAGKPVERHGARRSPVPENITAIGKGAGPARTIRWQGAMDCHFCHGCGSGWLS